MKRNLSLIINNGSLNRFGCRRRCSYCNWQRLKGFSRSHPSLESIAEWSVVSKGSITLSGGGDPLYNPVNPSEIPEYIIEALSAINDIRRSARIITREVSLFTHQLIPVLSSLRIPIPKLSLSFDDDLEKEISNLDMNGTEELRKLIGKGGLEFTLVADTIPGIRDIKTVVNRINKLQQDKLIHKEKLAPITIRENLRSFIDLRRAFASDLIEALRKEGINNVRWLPACVCREDNLYLIEKSSCFDNREAISGFDINPNYNAVFSMLSNNKHLLIYGSAVRYRMFIDSKIVPVRNIHVNDIDIFVKKGYLNILISRLQNLGFSDFLRKSKHRIVATHKFDRSFTVDISSVDSLDVAKVIISESDININRAYIYMNKVTTLDGFSLKDLLSFKAKILPHDYKFLNKSKRLITEEANRIKLTKAGFKVRKNVFSHLSLMIKRITNKLTELYNGINS